MLNYTDNSPTTDGGHPVLHVTGAYERRGVSACAQHILLHIARCTSNIRTSRLLTTGYNMTLDTINVTVAQQVVYHQQ